MAAGIIGMGFYVPDKILTNADLEKSLGVSAGSIFDRTGIRQRHIARPEEAASDLAVRAARVALDDADVAAGEIDLIIVATSTPDHCSPTSAAITQARLGAGKAAAFDLSTACAGFVYSLVLGCNMIESGLYRKVLVIGAEVMSTIVDWTDPYTAILFGDGAGAAVLGKVPEGYGLLGSDLGVDGSGADAAKVPAGGSRMPASAETVANRLHYIQMDGHNVFKFAMRVLGSSSERSLKAAGLGTDAIDLLVPHQANIRIIEAASRLFELPMEKVVVNIDRYGNTSAASVPIALSEAAAAGRIKRGDHVVMVAFGAGLAWGACVMKWF